MHANSKQALYYKACFEKFSEVNSRFLLSLAINIEILYLCTSPWGFPQEGETRFDTRVDSKAIDAYMKGEVLPAVFLYQLFEDGFESLSVKRVFWLGVHILHSTLCLEIIERPAKWRAVLCKCRSIASSLLQALPSLQRDASLSCVGLSASSLGLHPELVLPLELVASRLCLITKC